MTVEDFARLTLAEFGEDEDLAEEFADYSDLPHLQVAALARLMQRSKGAGNWTIYERAVALVAHRWRGADDQLRNALNVSLLEHLDFNGSRGPKAWELLTPDLQRAWQAMDAYNQWVHSGAKGPPPP